MNPALIRTASSEDLDCLVALERDSFASDGLDRRRFRYFLAAPTAAFRVVAEAGRVVGYYLLLFRAGASIARLYSIAVEPAARGRGLATALLDDAEAMARRRGATRLGLEVRDDNAPAIRLYEQRGYRLTGCIPDYYEDGAEARRYEKRVDRGVPARSCQMDD